MVLAALTMNISDFARQHRWFVVGAVAVIASVLVWRGVVYSASGAAIDSQIQLVCVESGERLTLSRIAVRSLPASHPRTGKQTLLPVIERDGRTKVDERCLEVLEGLKDVNRYVDEKSGEVRTAP